MISSDAESTSETQSIASSGLLGSNGALDLQAADAPGFEPATVDLGALLDQLLTQPVADTVLSEAVIEVGALGARAEKTDGVLSPEYMVSDLDVTLESPLVGTLGTTVEDTINTVVGDAVAEAVGPTGPLNSVLSTLSGIIDAVDLSIPLVGGLELNSNPALTTAQAASAQAASQGAADASGGQKLERTGAISVVSVQPR